jgi:hypothetical protein
MADKTKTNPDAETLPAVTLSVAHVKTVNKIADDYFATLNNIRRLDGELTLAKEGKLATVLKMARLACELATKGMAFDTSLALAYYDAADMAFCARMVQDDAKHRQQPGSDTLPEARKLVDIDRSYPVLRSTVRGAIKAGHKVTGTESKADLERASGKSNGRVPGGVLKPGQGDEPAPKNVTAPTIGKASRPMAAVLTNIAKLINDGMNETEQNELAARIVDVIAAFETERAGKATAKAA